MKKTPGGFSPVIAVDRKAARPLHRQIYDAYRALIIGRNLQPGQQIPSTRALALELGISRIPVLTAYSQLYAEGYFESRVGTGTFVSNSLPDQLTSCVYRGAGTDAALAGPRTISHRSALLPKSQDAPWAYGPGAFSVGQLAFDHFPFQAWSNLVARHARKVRASSLNYGDPMGSKEFRETIATYLRTARAVRCEAQQIMVVSGSQQALDIAARVLLDPGDPVWLEEPAYLGAVRAFAAAGARLVPVPVDEEGLDVKRGIKRCPHARVAVITPSHQFPLGMTLSARRSSAIARCRGARACRWVPRAAPGGVGNVPTASDPGEGGSSVTNAVQSMGLKLESRKAVMDQLIVDHVEKTPTEN